MAARTPLPFANTLVVYPDGVHKPGEQFWCRDAFVSRVVSIVANSNEWGCLADARTAARKLNAFDVLLDALQPFAAMPTGAESGGAYENPELDALILAARVAIVTAEARPC